MLSSHLIQNTLPFSLPLSGGGLVWRAYRSSPPLSPPPRWGPSVAGLSVIPLLPMYLDEVVEHGVEWAFSHYGPWAGQQKEHHAKKE